MSLPIRLTNLLILGVAAALAGCEPQITDLSKDGSPDREENPTPTPPEGGDPAVGIAAAATATMGLREVNGLEFNLTGFNGFTGDVTVTATNLPAGVTASPVTVNVATPDVAVLGAVELVSDNGTAVPDTYADVVLTATAAAIDPAIANVDLTLAAELSMDTRSDVAAQDVGDLWGADRDAGEAIIIHMGGNSSVMVTFINRSAARHLIHGGGDADGGTNDGNDNIGMDHGDTGSATAGTTNDPQTRELRPETLPLNVDFYCHTHGSPTVQQARITLMP